MELVSLHPIKLSEIHEAGVRWANYKGPERRNNRPGASSPFAAIARQWMHFHGCLIFPVKSPECFDTQLAEFRGALESRGLASGTTKNYIDRTRMFLRWALARCGDLSLLSLEDVDDFLARGRKAGWRLGTLSGYCFSLRTFFIFAEDRGWYTWGIWRGIVSPRLPKYTELHKGPTWADVRRLIRSVNSRTPTELRLRAQLLLFSIYGLRASEVARLRLDDFDWRSETFGVHRSKRGGIQQFPTQYEVGEAILDYLQHGRPKCASRFVFLTSQAPYHPLSPTTMRCVVVECMKKLGIQSAPRASFTPTRLRNPIAEERKLLERDRGFPWTSNDPLRGGLRKI